MSSQKTMLVINCKNYEISKDKIIELVEVAKRVSTKYNVRIAIAPPQHLVGVVSGGPVPIFAQHVDDYDVGSTTGHIVPELLRRSGVTGSLLNHSEHRISPDIIQNTLKRLDGLGMISVLCTRDVAETERYAKLCPDYIAIEPPELIGSGRAVSKERPELIKEAAAVRGKAILLCGAGIVSGEDVAKAVELGAEGVLVASGIVKSDDWERSMSDLAGSMRGSRQKIFRH